MGENYSEPPKSLSVVSNCCAEYNNSFVFQTVSELPETVAETVLLQQEDSRKKNAGQKKKNRERGKVKDNLWNVSRNDHQ